VELISDWMASILPHTHVLSISFPVASSPQASLGLSDRHFSHQPLPLMFPYPACLLDVLPWHISESTRRDQYRHSNWTSLDWRHQEEISLHEDECGCEVRPGLVGPVFSGLKWDGSHPEWKHLHGEGAHRALGTWGCATVTGKRLF